MAEDYRYKVLYGGRSAARSWSIGRILLNKGIKRPLRILCTRELQKSIKQSVHRLLSDQIRLMNMSHLYEVQKSAIYGPNGTEFTFLGVRANPEEIRSMEAIDICWIEEAHSLSEGSWDIIDPTIRKEGSEIWLSFNTRFKFDYVYQHFIVDKQPDALVIKSNYMDNQYNSDVVIKQAENLKVVDYEKYLHIWMGNLKRLAEGAIFGAQVTQVSKDGRLCFIPIQKNCEVMTFWDVGKDDPTAVWFMQKTGQQYKFIDYFQGRLEEIEYYTRFVRSRDYLYSMHYFPHDADHDRLGMSRNIKQQFVDGGVKPATVVDRIGHKAAAIALAREWFARCWFHLGDDGDTPVEECDGYYECDDKHMLTRATRMERGYATLCNYRYKYVEEDDVYQRTPHHDRASNGADAYMCFAQADMDRQAGMSDWSKPINY
jgi:phage terminase large subunit